MGTETSLDLKPLNAFAKRGSGSGGGGGGYGELDTVTEISVEETADQGVEGSVGGKSIPVFCIVAEEEGRSEGGGGGGAGSREVIEGPFS